MTKTLWGILSLICITVLFAFGITSVSTNVASNYALSEDSLKLLNTTNPLINDYYASVNGNLSADNINPSAEADLNGISEFFQEFKTYQTKYDQVKGAISTIYGLPDWILVIVPFVDEEQLGIYVNLYRAMIWVLVIIIFIKVLRGGQTD